MITLATFIWFAWVKEVHGAGFKDLFLTLIKKEETKKPDVIVKTFETEVDRISKKYGVDKTLSLKIMYCESRHYTRRENKNYDKNGVWWSSDWGRWQINDYYHEVPAQKLGLNIYDEWDNLEYGFILLSKEGTQPWDASRKCWDNDLTLEQLKLKYK